MQYDLLSIIHAAQYCTLHKQWLIQWANGESAKRYNMLYLVVFGKFKYSRISMAVTR